MARGVAACRNLAAGADERPQQDGTSVPTVASGRVVECLWVGNEDPAAPDRVG